MEVTSDILNDDDRVSPSYNPNFNKKFHIHRTSAWQDTTGQSRYSLCGVQIGPVGREVSAASVKNSAHAHQFCKSCLRLKANGAL